MISFLVYVILFKKRKKKNLKYPLPFHSVNKNKRNQSIKGNNEPENIPRSEKIPKTQRTMVAGSKTGQEGA